MVVHRPLDHYRRGGMSRLIDMAKRQLDYSYRYGMFGVERALLTDREWYEYTVRRNQRNVEPEAAADPRGLRYVNPEAIQRASQFNPRFC